MESIKINKLLVANRGEIAIRIFRAATELKIRTVAVYTYEDRFSLHRYKADEAFQIGNDKDPLKPYLNIEEIIRVAKNEGVDAIHPGYGFLSENVIFAERCREEGIVFVGPASEVMEQLGDKVAAKKIAMTANVPIIEDSREVLGTVDIALSEANRIGYPLILKAASGGGGRGMRVVKNQEELTILYTEARREARNAFGDDTVFLEKFIDNPKHIEVQILGDNHGNIVHLFERDCSVQRRFQKVVEIAPSMFPQIVKEQLYQYALAIAKTVNYNNAGTVEFLVDASHNIYFIEVNPRIQVEHTVTEEVTGIDLVRSQILIASGCELSSPEIGILGQEVLECNGFAIQCRITTEDPSNNFKPDYGKITAYRNAGGYGIRIDEGSSYQGMVISPFFDSMLAKITSSGKTLQEAGQRLYRALLEFRIRGVKTNIPFLENVINHETFQSGNAKVGFIESSPELFAFDEKKDRGSKILKYIANVSVNGHPDIKKELLRSTAFHIPMIPAYDEKTAPKAGTKQRLTELGPEKFSDWLKKEKQVHFTDTTLRDAHQSLLATRVRTKDMLEVTRSFAHHHYDTFSMEVWGGATFDVAMRFLKECPWERLKAIRKAAPNILLQMLIRGANAIGYTAYPDNLVEKFIEKSWENGVDIFRIFDSLNWVENMLVSIKAVRERTGGIAEACICYTGDILDPEKNQKYSLEYYIDLAKQLEAAGAHIIGIKDMAGLLKPYSAEVLIKELKKNIGLPIHLHTHDTSSIQSATYLKAIEAGVDVIDVALGAMSGLTSQPNFNSMIEMIKGSERQSSINIKKLNEFSNYWEEVREFYYPFESGLKAGTAEVFQHEIPGGQYSNLKPQAYSLGLGDKMNQIKKAYKDVNLLFGDIVKVTPSSKVVGDLALYMVSNRLESEDIISKGEEISFPDSVKNFFQGDLGQPPGGFPEKLQKLVLKDVRPFTDRPNAHLSPVDFEAEQSQFNELFPENKGELDFISYKFYPKVYEGFYRHQSEFGDISVLPTPVFFYGMKPNEENIIELNHGKRVTINLMYISEPDENGLRLVYFKLNGQTRNVEIKDNSIKIEKVVHRKISGSNHIGAPLQGLLSQVFVKEGDAIEKNTPLFVIEAMKMENTINATKPARIKKIHINAGTMVNSDDLIIEME